MLLSLVNSMAAIAQHQIPKDTVFTKDSENPARQYVIIHDEDGKTMATGSLLNGIHDGT